MSKCLLQTFKACFKNFGIFLIFLQVLFMKFQKIEQFVIILQAIFTILFIRRIGYDQNYPIRSKSIFNTSKMLVLYVLQIPTRQNTWN